MNNLLSYCGLVDAKLRASDKDLPVLSALRGRFALSDSVPKDSGVSELIRVNGLI